MLQEAVKAGVTSNHPLWDWLWNFWHSQAGANTINFLAATGACGAAIASWKAVKVSQKSQEIDLETRKIELEAKKFENSLKNPFMNPLKVTAKRALEVNTPFLTNIIVDIENSIREQLVQLKWAAFMFDGRNRIIEHYNSDQLGKGSNIGIEQKLYLILPFEQKIRDMFLNIVIYAHPVDRSKRDGGLQKIFIKVNFRKSNEVYEEVTPTFVTNPITMIELESEIITWCKKEDFNPSNVKYYPFE